MDAQLCSPVGTDRFARLSIVHRGASVQGEIVWNEKLLINSYHKYCLKNKVSITGNKDRQRNIIAAFLNHWRYLEGVS